MVLSGLGPVRAAEVGGASGWAAGRGCGAGSTRAGLRQGMPGTVAAASNNPKLPRSEPAPPPSPAPCPLLQRRRRLQLLCGPGADLARGLLQAGPGLAHAGGVCVVVGVDGGGGWGGGRDMLLPRARSCRCGEKYACPVPAQGSLMQLGGNMLALRLRCCKGHGGCACTHPLTIPLSLERSCSLPPPRSA